jgi:CPA1 family monovalent cation:H+ antiporter
LPVIAVLATAGVLISAAVTGAGMLFLARWDCRSALLFGVLIAATDPISVIALFREAGVHGRLRLLVEAESLFNDGTAAVAYGIAVTLAAGGQISAWGAVGTALTATGGGLLCGALVGQLTLFLIKRTEDYLVETACTAIAAYGSFLLADSLGISGVFATLAAGLMLGNLGPLRVISERGRDAVEAFWEFAAFVANSVVFLLVGMSEINSHFGAQWHAAVIAMLAVTAGRAASIYPLCSLFSSSSLRLRGSQRHVLFWAGLRGALALALAISIPSGVPRREEIVTVSFAVVAFSIFAHGLTIAPLMRRVGAIPREPLHAQKQWNANAREDEEHRK